MTQRQEFTAVKSYDGFELREYLPCSIAEVKVSADYSSAGSVAFRSLFGYISQGNKRSEKIAMTAPVISAQKADKSSDDEWFVSFVMPAGSTKADMPNPNDPRVVLRQLEAESCVAASFREKIALSDETRICRFDPPFKPGFLQYNEIVIPTL
jgi:hypothetical protein